MTFLDRLMRERKPGFLVVAQNFTHTIPAQFLRLQLSAGSSGGVGWLFALADKRMGAAIDAMHGDP